MDKNLVITILQSLANGVDPSTGEVLPNDSAYQDVDTVRALFTAIQLLGNTQDEVSEDSELNNSGTSWSAEEEGLLLANFNKGRSIKEIAKRHQRTTGAIRSRLKKMGMIEE